MDVTTIDPEGERTTEVQDDPDPEPTLDALLDVIEEATNYGQLKSAAAQLRNG